MTMKAFRKKHGIPIKRGMVVEVYLPSQPSRLCAKGKISSATEDMIFVNGVGFYPKEGVVYYGDDGEVLLDTRYSVWDSLTEEIYADAIVNAHYVNGKSLIDLVKCLVIERKELLKHASNLTSMIFATDEAPNQKHLNELLIQLDPCYPHWQRGANKHESSTD